MKVSRGLHISLRVGLSLALFAVLAWLLVLLLPPVSDAEFSELEAQRATELAKRSVGDMSLWNHQPLILAARKVGPFGHPGVSLLAFATLPAVMTAFRQVQPPLCFGLPLLKQESWLAFLLVLVYSALMWFVLGVLLASVVQGLRRLFPHDSHATAGA